MDQLLALVADNTETSIHAGGKIILLRNASEASGDGAEILRNEGVHWVTPD
jgi:hypothetical protein